MRRIAAVDLIRAAAVPRSYRELKDVLLKVDSGAAASHLINFNKTHSIMRTSFFFFFRLHDKVRFTLIYYKYNYSTI